MTATMTRAWLLATTACWQSATPVVTPPPPPSTVVRSCPVAPPRVVKQLLRVSKWIGNVGERSWAAVRHDQRSLLVGIGPGGLREVPLATNVDGHAAYAIVGNELWIAARGSGHQHALSRIDLAAARPVEQRDVGMFDATVTGGAVAIGIGLSRVIVANSYPNIRVQLHDRASGGRVGELVESPSTILDSPEARCTGDDCFVVGIASGEGKRQLLVDRFDPMGVHEREVLADDDPFKLATVARGDRTVVLWLADRRLHARVLDRRGKPLTPATRVEGTGDVLQVEAFGDGRRVYVGVQNRERAWRIGILDASAARLDDIARPAFESAFSLLGAVGADGALVAGFSTNVDYDHGYHSWWARADAAFLPARSEPEPPIEVQPHTGGDGRGGMAAFPLVAPGHAAILVSPVGPESGQGGQLVVLREPCP